MSAAGLPSIQRRLVRMVLGAVMLGSVVLAAVVWWLLPHEIDEVMDEGLRESAEILHNVLARHGIPAPLGDTNGPPLHQETLVWQLIDLNTQRVSQRSHQAPLWALATELRATPQDSGDGVWRLVTMPVPSQPGQMLLVAQAEEERREVRNEATLLILLVALGLGGLLTLLLRVVLARELMPLQHFSHALEMVDPSKPMQLPAVQRAELLPMQRAVDALSSRLMARVASERAFTAHAAHALRTPLAGIDTQLALACQQAPADLQERLQRVRRAAQKLHRVVQALLSMFRAGAPVQIREVNLRTLLEGAVAETLTMDLSGPDNVHADADLLAAALLNLLDNAQRHGARHLRVRVERDIERQSVLLHDDGQGCPRERLEGLRVALRAQGGSDTTALPGLGLALADMVMRAHGGDVTLPDVTEGFAVCLRWPSQAGTTG